MADDLAQTVFLKAFEKQAGLRKASSTRAWLFQIAYRVFLDEFRKTARRQGLALKQVETENNSVSDPGLAFDIEAAMNSLPEDCRAVVLLCLSHGMSHSETAKITGLPLGTVKSHLSRGKTKLQTFLRAYETT